MKKYKSRIDTAELRKKLQDEYINNGGTNPKDFMQGMIWFEYEMLNGQDECLNEIITVKVRLKKMNHQLKVALQHINTQKREIEKLKEANRELIEMGYTARKKFRKDNENKRIVNENKSLTKDRDYLMAQLLKQRAEVL